MARQARFQTRLNVETLEDRCTPAQFGGSAAAVFVNPSPPDAVVTGIGTQHFTWGDPCNYGTGPSSLDFAGSRYDTPEGKVFSLGRLTYFNGTVVLGTSADSVDFQTRIRVEEPVGVKPATRTLTFHFNLVDTPNIDNDPEASADYVYLPSLKAVKPLVFTTRQGDQFTLELVGFGRVNGGGFTTVDQFHVYEGASATADVLARFVHVPWLRDVTFGGGGNYHPITADDNSRIYDSQHWLDLNADGDISDPGEHAWPVSYTRQSTFEVTAHFHLSLPENLGNAIWVRADGPGNLDISPTPATQTDNQTITVTGALAEHPFSNSIRYFDTFQLNWQMSLDGGATWQMAGRSLNTIYVTLGDPATTLFHTVARIGAVRGNGLKKEADVVKAIWSEFSDRRVFRYENPMLLTYWQNGQATATNTAGLLHDGNGQCGSWAAFFRDTLWAEGITTAHKYMVEGVNDFPNRKTWMMVKKWHFQGSGSDYGYGHYRYRVDHDVFRLDGVPGQGNPDPVDIFGNHFVTIYDGKIYDPSYGSGPFNRREAWEAASLDGYCIEVFGGELYARKENHQLLETIWTQVY